MSVSAVQVPATCTALAIFTASAVTINHHVEAQREETIEGPPIEGEPWPQAKRRSQQLIARRTT
jgi:hypothetical protein